MLKRSRPLFCWMGSAVFLMSMTCLGISDENKADLSSLDLDRIYGSTEFRSESWSSARWLEDGTGYVAAEKAGPSEGAVEIILYDLAGGRREVLASAEHLVPVGQKGQLKVAAFELSKDKKKLLILTNPVQVWHKTRGDYWVLDLKNWDLHRLGGDAEGSSLLFAKFSPDGARVGYVIKNNIFVEDLQKRTITQLTTDGSERIINGGFDWVYEEELGLRDGWRWSPDGNWIAYWQLDTAGVETFYIINNTDSLYPKLLPLQYPKAGQTNSASRIGIVSSGGGETKWLELEGDPRSHYLASLNWAGDSEEVCFQRLNRLQNTNWVMLGNRKSGEVRTIAIDRDDAWVDVAGDVRWIEQGRKFLLLSERDGWRHVYSVTRSQGQTELLTKGEYDVESLAGVDEDKGCFYFIGSPENPTQRYLYRAGLDGSGKAERITPGNQPGGHSYNVSPDARWAFHTYSSFGVPPSTELISLPDHKTSRTLVANSVLKKKVSALRQNSVEFFKVDIGDGTVLDGWLMKPPDFDPERKYPLLFYVYGEPNGYTVADRWGGDRYLWHLMLTQKGYLVASIDNRGTKGPRGREWRKSIYRQVGILAVKDQATALRRLLQDRPYIDSQRVGIWGWSGGGQMSLNMIFRYPDLYSTAMAIAFVSDQRLYDTIYQERYMGLPSDNVEGYREGSPIVHAQNLEGNLLIVHGTGDDNVHYQNFEKLANELIKHDRHFTMMSYPNRSHSISERTNTTMHLFGLLTRFLIKNMPPGPRQ